MPAPAIKLCGLNTREALDAAIRARADYAGFVFFPRSPRHLDLVQAAQLSAQAEGRIARVGLVVDADDAMITDILAAAPLEVLQLHGQETPERAAQIRNRFGLPVWKAHAVRSQADVDKARSYAGAADRILFDAKTPEGALPGGMGLSFDWSLVANWKGPLAWGLAGGLAPETVAEAIRLTGTPLVDTSSGIETAPGVKDTARIAAFCRAVRG